MVRNGAIESVDSLGVAGIWKCFYNVRLVCVILIFKKLNTDFNVAGFSRHLHSFIHNNNLKFAIGSKLEEIGFLILNRLAWTGVRCYRNIWTLPTN